MPAGDLTRICALTGLYFAPGVGIFAAQTFTNSDGPISVAPSSGVYTRASRYPSQITVPNSVAGTISSIAVTLHGFSADGNTGLSTQGLGILLTSPDGRQFEIFRGAGNGNDTLANVTLSIADANAAPAPNQTKSWPLTTGIVAIKPSAYADGSSPTNYVNPGPGVPAHTSAPAGTGTFGSVFHGATAAGTWKLFVVDHLQGDHVSFTSWDLVVTAAASQTSTTTTLGSNPNPSFTSGTGSAVALTATVAGARGSPVGTVAFQDGGLTIGSCSASPLSPSGANTSSATCPATFPTEGSHSIAAVYSGGGNVSPSASAPLSQFVKNHTTSPSANQSCNTGPIAMTGVGITFPYPSVINIGTDTPGIAGSVSTVSVTLNNFASPAGVGGVKALLVGPGGSKSLVFLSGAGFSGSQPPVTVTFADSAAGQVAQNGALNSGSFAAASYDSPILPSAPAPAPQVPVSVSIAAPGGGAKAQTFTTAFRGSVANGDWSLFVFDNAGSQSSASISGGWCLNITPSTAAALGSSGPGSHGRGHPDS